MGSSNFWKQLSATTLGASFSSSGKQLFGAAFDNNFGERLWGTALWSSFGEQLWEAGAALRSSFARQLRTAALKNRSFGEQLWRLALERNFEVQLSVATLRGSFREPLWRIALGSSSFGATALRRCFGEQLWEAAAGWGVALWSSSGEQEQL